MANRGDGVGVTPRVGEVTLAAWTKQVTNETLQNYIALAMMMQKGLIDDQKGGGENRWPFQYRRIPLKGMNDNSPSGWVRQQTVKNARVAWALYEAKNSASEYEEIQNSGDAAIVDLFDDQADMMRDDAAAGLAGQIYVNGAGTVNDAQGDLIASPFHGLETFCEGIGALTAETDEIALTLNGTYGGHSTAYDAFKPGATSADSEYGVWSPRIINCNVQDSAGANLAWEDHAHHFIRRGVLNTAYGQAKKNQVDLVLLRQPSHEKFLNLLDDKEQKILQGHQMAAAYGFDPTGAVNFDGALVMWDLAVPSADANGKVIHGYGLNTNKMRLKLLKTKRGIRGKGSIFTFYENVDEEERVLWKLRLYGQLRFISPRHFFALKELSA